jgi:hypothetical protein
VSKSDLTTCSECFHIHTGFEACGATGQELNLQAMRAEILRLTERGNTQQIRAMNLETEVERLRADLDAQTKRADKAEEKVANLLGDVEVIRKLLDYDLSDLPPGDEHRTCNTRLYQANMRAFRICMEATKDN